MNKKELLKNMKAALLQLKVPQDTIDKLTVEDCERLLED